MAVKKGGSPEYIKKPSKSDVVNKEFLYDHKNGTPTTLFDNGKGGIRSDNQKYIKNSADGKPSFSDQGAGLKWRSDNVPIEIMGSDKEGSV